MGWGRFTGRSLGFDSFYWGIYELIKGKSSKGNFDSVIELIVYFEALVCWEVNKCCSVTLWLEIGIFLLEKKIEIKIFG